MKKNVLMLAVLFYLFLIRYVSAHCPICTAATGTAVITARWFGIDDLIVGTFFGGFLISSTLWFNNILKNRNKGKEFIPYQGWLLILISLVSTLFIFYTMGLSETSILIPKFTIFGVSKLFLGVIIGSIVTLFAFYLHEILRKINENKNYLPFQSIILSLILLLITSVSFYLLGWV